MRRPGLGDLRLGRAGWQSFATDPEVPAILQEAGFTQGPPKSAEFLREHYA